MGDDGPGQPRHGDVPDHPEGGEHTEGAAPLTARLEFCEVSPDQGDAASYPGHRSIRVSGEAHLPQSTDEPEGQEGGVVLTDAGHSSRHGVDHHGHYQSVPPAVNVS